MTRGEAATKVAEALVAKWPKYNSQLSSDELVIALEALGLIKFDEPAFVLRGDLVAPGTVQVSTAHLLKVLTDAGYKVVKDETDARGGSGA